MFDLIYRFDPAASESRPMPQTWAEACRLLVQGNREFAEMTEVGRSGTQTRVIPFDPRAFGWGVREGEAPVQAPFAAVLGCADARVPTEMVFSKGCNELFVVRVAGNVLGQECLGSLRYAANHFPSTLRLLVVLAHARCGAVTEAVNVYLEPRRYLEMATDSSLRSIEDQILVAVRVAVLGMELVYGSSVLRAPGCRAALLETAIVLKAGPSVELPGEDHLLQAFDQDVLDRLIDEVEEFITGERHRPEPDRTLATVMFTDVVGSTEHATRLGDRQWHELLTGYYAAVRKELGAFRGREVNTAGDGLLATFDGPARAIRCACAIRERVKPLGLQVRTGLHTGECELIGDEVSGIAVHIGARVASAANPDEVLVSSTVRDLVAGSGIKFSDRGPHTLKGVADEWRLFAVQQ
jgi:class 3 adenylate cyclase